MDASSKDEYVAWWGLESVDDILNEAMPQGTVTYADRMADEDAAARMVEDRDWWEKMMDWY